MKGRIVCLFSIMALLVTVSFASAGVELSYVLGMKDGSESSDGVTVRFIVEEAGGKATQVSEEHWDQQQWSDPFIADLTPWGGKTITLSLTTDPGPDRNTGWDWILIGDAKVTADGKLVLDIGQAVADGTPKLAMLLDDDNAETDSLANGANSQVDNGESGGATKPKQFMQHPPWDGRVGNTISRYEIALPAVDTTAVEAGGKSATTWGRLKAN